MRLLASPDASLLDAKLVRPASGRGVILQVYRRVGRNNLGLVTAGLAFYASLAVGPAFVALVSIYGLFASPRDMQELLEPALRVVPPHGGRVVLRQLLDNAVQSAPRALTMQAAGAIAVSLWSAHRGVRALIKSVGLAYTDTIPRSFVRESLVSLVVAVFGTVLVAIVSGIVIATPPLLRHWFPELAFAKFALSLRYPAGFVVMLIGLSALYRWAPRRATPLWRATAIGAFAATVGCLLSSTALTFYAARVGGIRTGLEGVDSALVLVLWFYACAWSVLLGAELNAAIEEQPNEMR